VVVVVVVEEEVEEVVEQIEPTRLQFQQFQLRVIFYTLANLEEAKLCVLKLSLLFSFSYRCLMQE
jgi:hypothetical protein